MGKKNHLELLYRTPDTVMYEAAQTCLDSFDEDKADFVTFDADFDDPFEADVQALIDLGEAIQTPDSINDELQQLTVTVEEKMDACRKKFQDAKFFIEKAFPKNAARWHEFGYEDYERQRKSQLQMIAFMANFHRVADKYKLALIAAGYSQPMIDEIETLRTALKDANRDQESFMKGIPQKTRDRYTANNNVWEKFALICSAGKRIYIDNSAKYQRYLLPPAEETPGVPRLSGTVSDSVHHLPLGGVVIVAEPGGYNRHTFSDGHWAFGTIPDGTYVFTFSRAGYQPQTQNMTFVPGDGPFVIDFEMTPV